MANAFGDLLRLVREHAGVSMGALARALMITTPYLSDVERGNRRPFSESRIRQCAEILQLSREVHTRLLAAAAESRGFFELGMESASHAKQEFGAALSRGWAELDDQQIEQMNEILHRGK